jgi:hypothetical protein
MMGFDCEHEEGSPMGHCAICGDMTCSECFRTIFNQTICAAHQDLEDESGWELVGFYSSEAAMSERRYYLEEQGITSIVVDTDEEAIELYVPEEEKDDAYAALVASGEDTLYCASCQVQYAPELETCPLCGVRAMEE